MVLKRALPLLTIILMLAGCFRQADEPFDTVDSQNAPNNQQVASTPEITIINPNSGDVSATPANSQQVEPTATIIVINPATEIIPTATTETIIVPPTSEPLIVPTATESGFITPEIAVEVEIPTATPVVAIDEPTLEPTPTAFGEELVASECQYIVQVGDNLFRIALNNNVSLDALLLENGLSQASIIQPGQVLTLPGCTDEGTTSEEEVVVEEPVSLSECQYVVQANDTLFAIAIRNNVTLDALLLENNLVETSIIQPGQILTIPDCGDDQSSLAPSAEATEDLSSDTDTSDENVTIHTVAAGETLLTIARRYGVTVNDIIQANTISNPNSLSIGQQLVIPEPETDN